MPTTRFAQKTEPRQICLFAPNMLEEGRHLFKIVCPAFLDTCTCIVLYGWIIQQNIAVPIRQSPFNSLESPGALNKKVAAKQSFEAESAVPSLTFFSSSSSPSPYLNQKRSRTNIRFCYTSFAFWWHDGGGSSTIIAISIPFCI